MGINVLFDLMGMTRNGVKHSKLENLIEVNGGILSTAHAMFDDTGGYSLLMAVIHG